MKKVRVWISRDTGMTDGLVLVWAREPKEVSRGKWEGYSPFYALKPGDCREFFLVPVAKGGKGGRP